jgi:hypothetical protein
MPLARMLPRVMARLTLEAIGTSLQLLQRDTLAAIGVLAAETGISHYQNIRWSHYDASS